MKAVLILGLCCSLVASAAMAQSKDCKPVHSFKTITPGEITVFYNQYPPFAYQDSSGQLKGIDVDILQQIAHDNCVKINAMVVDNAAVVQGVVAGKADLAIGGWYRSEARSKVLGLSDPVTLDLMGIASKDGVSDVSQMAKRKVGTVTGFLWVSDLKKMFGDNLQLYPTSVALAQDLASGRLDVGVDSYILQSYGQKLGSYRGLKVAVAKPNQQIPSSIQPAQTAFLYTKDNKAFGEAIDDTIEKMRKDGAILKIVEAYGQSPSIADVGAPRLAK
jgi:polar amino acid transport system substrate-binding protein